MTHPSYEERDKRIEQMAGALDLFVQYGGNIIGKENAEVVAEDLRSLLSEVEGLRASLASRASSLHGPAGEISTPLEVVAKAIYEADADISEPQAIGWDDDVARHQVYFVLAEAALNALSPSLGEQGEVGKEKGLGASSALALDDQCQAETEREVLEAAITAASWLERWGSHVGACRGDPWCTCGLTAVNAELARALDPSLFPNPPSAEERS